MTRTTGTRPLTQVETADTLYTRGKISRRQFMQALSAAGLSAAASGIVLASADRARAQSTPKRGGVLRFAYDASGPADTLDPTLAVGGIDQAKLRMIYSSLMRLTETLEVVPEIATEYSVSNDGLTYRFSLRRGVTFHDGKPLTADDVVYSMNLHIGPDTKSSAKGLVSMISAWRKIDDHTVEAQLATPNADLPKILGVSQFKIVQDGTTDFSRPQGTGPFKVEEFTPGVRFLATRFDDYWADGPWLDGIELFSIPDASARTNALVTGDVHLIANVSLQTAPIIEATPGVGLLSVPTGSFPTIVMNRASGPGTSLDFRKGLQHLQRREEIVSGVFKGLATIGGDQPIGSAYGVDHCTEVGIPEFDPDLAKHHLNKSGVEGVTIHVATINAGIEEMALLLQNEARQIGFDIEIKRVPADGYWGSVWGKTEMFVGRWNMRPTAATFYPLAYTPGGAWNSAQWNNERMAAILEELPAIQDPALRYEMHCEAQGLIQAESGHLVPAHPNFVDGLSDRVQGMTRVPVAPVGGAEWPEFVWLDE